jgi:glycosyltransferase involved in cell wall biosynthesis
VDAIVPAYNEGQTVADVVGVLVQARVFRRVLVVDDGSEDDTAQAAAAAGAQVLPMGQNSGKGAAMLAAVADCPGDVAFFDADLVGFQPHHAHQLVYGYEQGYDMVCGLREYDSVGNVLQAAMGPIITGERVVRRWILELLPPSCWDGYSIETAMNFVCDQWGGRVALMPMNGVRIRGKVNKGGILKGLRGHASMFSEIAATRRMLTETDGAACKL